MAKRVERTRNASTLTEAGFKALIVSALREKSRWWKPKQECIRKARVRKGIYLCEHCEQEVGAYFYDVYKTGKKKGKKRKVRNILADHIAPVVDPAVGFVDWNTYIERMFIETGWQAICHKCHSEKTKTEASIAKERRKNARN